MGLLDADIYGPSQGMMLGLSADARPDIKNDHLLTIKAHGLLCMSMSFVASERTPAIWRGPMVARMTQQFFDNVDWDELDYLILDLPPGTGDIQLTLVQKTFVNGAIIVTTPQDLSLVDVRKGSDMFKKVNVPVLGVVENMSSYFIDGQIEGFSDIKNIDLKINGEKISGFQDDGKFQISVDIFKGLGGSSESKRLEVPLLGKLNIDSNLSVSGDNGKPYVLNFSDTYNSNEFKKIANLITPK